MVPFLDLQQHIYIYIYIWNFFHTPEFHGIPWNSMEFFLQFFHGIPWNLINFIFKKIIFLNIVFCIWLMIRYYLAKISQKRYILHWFQYLNSYFEYPSVSENGARSAKMACCYTYIYISDVWYCILLGKSLPHICVNIESLHDMVMQHYGLCTANGRFSLCRDYFVRLMSRSQ